MSECVVRMEMPECCNGCPMEYDGFMCSATTTRFYPKKDGRYLKPLIDPFKERLPNCPIICALPEGHGRLVDGDRLKNASTDGRKWCDPCPVWGEIYTAETIVPAERSET